MSDSVTAKFSPGDLIIHNLFEYRGVVIDLDPHFLGSADWYDNVAKSKPPKDRPWYHVLVDGGDVRTYVAERNLQPDPSGRPIKHPEINTHFARFGGDGYIPLRKGN
ncbi:MAG: heat shock protein HspQ [Alphaproteobacteria bacterium]|jgi:heat shock protein HspQ|nr:heat shock protein HspQ [Alphaproteobacteria bacterium]MBT7942948.1 heat shock protein HspQ [Alphaproteobacteria bacterium]